MKTQKPLSRRQIIALLKKNQDVLKKYSVKKIGLFGSYATGRQTKASDIDVLVEFERPPLDNFMDLAFYLEDLFGRKVDLLTTTAVQHIRIKQLAEDIMRTVIYV